MVNMFPFPHSSAETVYLQSRSHLCALSYKVFLDYLALMEKFQDIAKVTQTYLCPHYYCYHHHHYHHHHYFTLQFFIGYS